MGGTLTKDKFGLDEKLDWLQLWRSENVGPIAFSQLLTHFGSARAALDALPHLAKRGGGARPIRIFPRPDVEAEMASLSRAGASMIFKTEPDFPQALAALPEAPPLLSYIGRRELLTGKHVAIVGARNASANGRRIAEILAGGLANHGYVVVSGLARGIDAAAHKGALMGSDALIAGGTIAVLAGGADVIYPAENEGLYHQIEKRGLILAELPMGAQPAARNFPRRNRIISGLSLGVIVVEAALKSGSLITARFALDQGRILMAVPGSPLDPRCSGCNKLIRGGAALVENLDHILEHIEPMFSNRMKEPETSEFSFGNSGSPDEKELDRYRQEIVTQLSPSPVGVDELLRQCQCSGAILGMVLLELELAGRLERYPGNRVSLMMDKLV